MKTTGKQRRAQVTIFIILGLVMLMLAAIIIYAGVRALRIRTAERAAADQLMKEVEPVRQYIESSLDLAAEEAFKRLGSQGGLLCREIDGAGTYDCSRLPSSVVLNNNGRYVPYAILPMARDLSVNNIGYLMDEPRYPWDGFPKIGVIQTYNGYFGSIMDDFMRNDWVSAQAREYVGTNVENIIQGGINQFVQQGYQIDPDKSSDISPESIEVSIRESDVVVTLHADVEITKLSTGASVVLREFSAVQQIRFKKIRDFVIYLAAKDTSDISYPIDSESPRDGMSVAVEHTPSGDSIVTITDRKSLVQNEPYAFSFARKNRRPALIEQANGAACAIIGDVPANIALDPDEDQLTITCEPNDQPGSTMTVADAGGLGLSDNQIITT